MKDDEKYVHTARGVVLVAEVLERLGVPYEVALFSDGVKTIKYFHETLSTPGRKKLLQILKPYGNTYEGRAVNHASQQLREQSAAEKFLIVFDDGGPSDSGNLIRTIENITKEGEQHLIGIGLGPGTGHVAHYYRHALPNLAVTELSEKLSGLLYQMITNPHAFK